MCSFLALELKSCSWNENKDVDFNEMSFFSFVFELFVHLENVKSLTHECHYKFRVAIATFGQNVMKFKIFHFSVSFFLRCNTVTCSKMKKTTYYFRLIPLANETGLFQYSYVEVTIVTTIKIFSSLTVNVTGLHCYWLQDAENNLLFQSDSKRYGFGSV